MRGTRFTGIGQGFSIQCGLGHFPGHRTVPDVAISDSVFGELEGMVPGRAFYSDLRVFTGLARAARKACQLIVSIVMTNEIIQARTNIHQRRSTR